MMLQRIIKGEDGCTLAASCFQCPAPDCMLGEGVGGSGLKVTPERHRWLLQQCAGGASTLRVSLELGISRRTAQKYLQRPVLEGGR